RQAQNRFAPRAAGNQKADCAVPGHASLLRLNGARLSQIEMDVMNCERYQTELEDFLYGELSENRAAELRAHLAACPACAQARETLAHEQEIFAQYYEQTALEPTPELWETVRMRIQAE